MSKHGNKLLAFALGLLSGACGCAIQRHELHPVDVARGYRGVVISLDGAGGFHAASDSARRSLRAERLPIESQTYAWSQGYARVFADQMNYCHLVCEGEHLAANIVAMKQAHPEAAIYLIAHSAGSQVALTALESLPPDTLERVALLAPAVSARYDLRAALRCPRGGIDVYYSELDLFFLGFATSIIGTTDRRWLGPVAGRTGFFACVGSCEDSALYLKLRQHPWQPEFDWTGNNGGHYGSYQEGYMRAVVLPQLVGQ